MLLIAAATRSRALPGGAKALGKHKFADAFRSFGAAEEARDAVGVARKPLVVVDGNVLVMQTPAAVDTFAGYVAVLANQLHGAIGAGEHAVVVFDEPAAMTRAKQEEQRKRDARRAPQTPVWLGGPRARAHRRATTRPRRSAWTRGNVRVDQPPRGALAGSSDALCVAALSKLRTTLVGDPCAWSVP